jgi:hypothetical protein
LAELKEAEFYSSVMIKLFKKNPMPWGADRGGAEPMLRTIGFASKNSRLIGKLLARNSTYGLD